MPQPFNTEKYTLLPYVLCFCLFCGCYVQAQSTFGNLNNATEATTIEDTSSPPNQPNITTSPNSDSTEAQTSADAPISAITEDIEQSTDAPVISLENDDSLTNFADLPEGVFAQGNDPENVADHAITNWQTYAAASPLSNFNLTAYIDDENPQAGAERMCYDFGFLGNSPDVITSFEVNLDSRTLIDEHDDGNIRVYSYAAGVKESTVLARIQVVVQKTANDTALNHNIRPNGTRQNAGIPNAQENDVDGTVWQAVRIQSSYEGLGGGFPEFLSHPLAPWIFSILSLYVLFLLVRPSWYRRWLAQGITYIRAHPIVTTVALILLYGSYFIGTASGANLPTCQVALINVINSSLTSSGILDAIDGDNVAAAATIIASWNFVQGAITTTFSPAIIFGIPAYLVNIPRFFMLGFALAPTPDTLNPFLWHIPVIVVELLAYILVTAGGGMLLVTVIREGMRSFGKGLRKLIYMLPIAFLLLVIGAWYEALEILVIIPRL